MVTSGCSFCAWRARIRAGASAVAPSAHRAEWTTPEDPVVAVSCWRFDRMGNVLRAIRLRRCSGLWWSEERTSSRGLRVRAMPHTLERHGICVLAPVGFLQARPRLFGIAYRMLGSAGGAAHAVGNPRVASPRCAGNPDPYRTVIGGSIRSTTSGSSGTTNDTVPSVSARARHRRGTRSILIGQMLSAPVRFMCMRRKCL